MDDLCTSSRQSPKNPTILVAGSIKSKDKHRDATDFASTSTHYIHYQKAMSRGRKPLEVIDIDNDDEFILESEPQGQQGGLRLTLGQTPKKIDFTVTRKKGQTPKKRGIFTPLKISSDIKPKVEPESPSVKNTMPIVTLRATKSKASVQPKVEPDLDEAVAEGSSELGAGAAATALKTGKSAGKDVKPDITALESLLDGLNLEQSVLVQTSLPC